MLRHDGVSKFQSKFVRRGFSKELESTFVPGLRFSGFYISAIYLK